MSQFDDATLQYWIDTLMCSGQDLTRWEENFLAGMEDLLKKGHKPTDGQVKTLSDLFENKVP